ncbi:hypothetical protein [Hyphococcus luteus]|uniref:hypothetical protein n=1 Tax=Hyphococcus luteus TaxID=2058213 RepID=UPI0010570198|nr:hypothetical protein [Marinicaulis flavus]
MSLATIITASWDGTQGIAKGGVRMCFTGGKNVVQPLTKPLGQLCELGRPCAVESWSWDLPKWPVVEQSRVHPQRLGDGLFKTVFARHASRQRDHGVHRGAVAVYAARAAQCRQEIVNAKGESLQYGIVSDGGAMNANAFTHNLFCRIEAAHVAPSSVSGRISMTVVEHRNRPGFAHYSGRNRLDIMQTI